MIVALSGGVGGAKLVLGLSRAVGSLPLTAIVNTGDDLELHGLRICPDLDTVIYTLSGNANPETGWGVAGDSFHCLDRLGVYGAEAWFRIGDRDLATHLWRTHLLRQGLSLTKVVERVCEALEVKTGVLPMCDDYVPTYVQTTAGELHLQEYLVRDGATAHVCGFRYSNIEDSTTAPGVSEAILQAQMVVMCPSNPFISIGPMLAVPGMKKALVTTTAPVVAVSPIVGGRAAKGPAGQMLADLGLPVSAVGVAGLYEGLADVFVLDQQDENCLSEIEALGMKAVVLDTMMRSLQDKQDLARRILEIP